MSGYGCSLERVEIMAAIQYHCDIAPKLITVLLGKTELYVTLLQTEPSWWSNKLYVNSFFCIPTTPMG